MDFLSQNLAILLHPNHIRFIHEWPTILGSKNIIDMNVGFSRRHFDFIFRFFYLQDPFMQIEFTCIVILLEGRKVIRVGLKNTFNPLGTK